MTVLEEFSNEPEKLEYYQSRQRIQMAELSVESEHRRIREDYDNAIKQRDNAIAENHQIKQKLAKVLLDANTMSIEQIAATAELSVEEVSNLKG